MSNPTSIVFLDIDGVLQPFTQKRFEHIREVPELCRELEQKSDSKYRYAELMQQSLLSPYDIAAVYYDWDMEAVACLKRLLKTTGSKIVLSSSWRESRTFSAMEALFAIHGLDGNIYDITFCATNVYWSPLERTEAEQKRDHELYERFIPIQRMMMDNLREAYPSDGSWGSGVDYRTLDILEWLERHPCVVSYVAVDDRNLSLGLGSHFVKVDRIADNAAMNMRTYEKMIKALQLHDGPYGLPASCHGPSLDEWRDSILPVCEAHWKSRK